MPGCHGLTPRAGRLLDVVRAADPGQPLAFIVSGGCCGGTNPVLVPRSSVLEGFDEPLGDAGGVAVFAHPDHAAYLRRNRFVIDALEGVRGDTFSLEIAHGGRFILRELPQAQSTADS